MPLMLDLQIVKLYSLPITLVLKEIQYSTKLLYFSLNIIISILSTKRRKIFKTNLFFKTSVLK